MREILLKFPSLAVGAISLCLLAGADMALADDEHQKHISIARSDDDANEYDRIRDSVKAGKLLPLAAIKARVAGRWPGEIVDVSISHEHEAISYELRILGANGRMIEVEVNAANGVILEVEND